MSEELSADAELAAMRVTIEALRTLPDRRAWQRALDWIVSRLGEDERGLFVRNSLLIEPEPLQYCLNGNMHELADSPESAAEYVDAYEVFEVNSIGIASQKFGVRFLIGNEQGDTEGDEIEWFDTRAEADAFASAMKDPDPMEGRGDPS